MARLEGDYPKALIAHMYDIYETLKSRGFLNDSKNLGMSAPFSTKAAKPIHKKPYTA